MVGFYLDVNQNEHKNEQKKCNKNKEEEMVSNQMESHVDRIKNKAKNK